MTFSAAVNPIIDAVLALIEVPDGWDKISTAAPPPVYEPNKLYCWALPQQPKPAGMDGGDQVELWFYLRLAWSVGTDEETGQVRLRTTSDVIDDGLEAIEGVLRANRDSEVWEWIQVDRMDPNAIVTFQERAGAADVSGYRIV